MKRLTPKLLLDNAHELSKIDPYVDFIMKEFLHEGAECKECDKANLSLSLFNYAVNAMGSKDKSVINAISDCLGGGIYVEEGGERINIIRGRSIASSFSDLSLFVKLKNLILSILSICFKSLKYRDSFLADKNERMRRVSICKSCRKYNPELESCSICGCPVVRKAKFKHSECPDSSDKWRKNV